MSVFINQLGYEPGSSKGFVVQSAPGTLSGDFRIIDLSTRTPVHQGTLVTRGAVAKWKDWTFFTGDFSEVQAPGRYAVVVPALDGEPLRSDSFAISENLYRRELLTDLLHYVKGQRCSHIWDRADRSAKLFGTGERRDVHGGWYDASGDVSKYLSHLSYANFMNPQQTPFVVWSFLHAAGRIADLPPFFQARLLDETLYGADFLVRMQDPSGAFYMTVFDKWSKDPQQRDICAYATRNGTKSDAWQASYRQGGGMTVAALARVSTLGASADYTPAQYLEAARRGFEALEAHGPSWCDDGVENIVDDYCALLAATELYAASGDQVAKAAADRRAKALQGRLTSDGWWRADRTGDRSFFHGADAGLPVLALLRYLEVFPGAPGILQTVEASVRFELKITSDTTNPFGYPRQYVQMPGRAGKSQFFLPHDNESGYWWQGENARLGSLASAAFEAAKVFPDLAGALAEYGENCVHWILGRNPFDIGMMHGKGHNNPQYEPGFYPAPGGVCNGITSEIDDEDSIAFHPTEEVGFMESWRWGEQWMPHGAWLFLAVATR